MGSFVLIELLINAMTFDVILISCSLLQENPKPTTQMVEDNFDGHICRCTGMYEHVCSYVLLARLLS